MRQTAEISSGLAPAADQPGSGKPNKASLAVLARLLPFLSSYRLRMAQALAALLLAASMVLLVPIAFRQIIDRGFGSTDQIAASFLLLGGLAIVLGMAIVAGGELLQMPMLGAHVNDIAPDRARGAYNGAYGVNFTFALVFAPALGGFVYERMGADALWWSCAVLGSIGALLFATEAARARRSAAA